MTYASVKMTHVVVVNIFLIIYVVKLILLLTKPVRLQAFTKAVRLPEMIVSLLFLLTGGYMLVEKPDVSSLQIIKLVLVFLSIPLAVVGFRKQIKWMASLSVLMVIGAYGLAEMNKNVQSRKKAVVTNVNTIPGSPGYDAYAHGELLYHRQLNCVSCHGPAGDAMVAGAPNLRTSTLTLEEITALLAQGRGMMPPYKDLTAEERQALAQYVISLRN
ncbi:MAG: cytochrome c [Flavobacteriales bacterium]|nr:cytochrome c [Flavobacteriales bacterium]MCX7769183.1 cytochrome c [Flavobacteriales bacterium]MDW8410699.1 cytochrome c [Flavobacteriales bacterium]